MAKAAVVKKIRIELVRSLIGTNPNQKATAKALGLGRINSSVVQDATPAVVGMVRTISHLVTVEDAK
ncbi:MAG: 50S ribosomal protein L30 [Spirochaetes bacterium GWB1_48_6]|nr:MAG: 50S ribosomal protein L30 [Spirochaetes bacterium GWB1_48_6]